jgi:NAD(P)-dependent dehydrogenase (short-subunit alcohol dehydrogenase family)
VSSQDSPASGIPRLQHKVAIVTGADGAIGRSLVAGLLADGASVFGCDLNLPDSLPVGGRYMAAQADVSSDAEVAAVVGTVQARFGRVDILINNAGLLERCSIDEMHDEASFSRSLGTNLFGPLHFIRHVVPIMKSQGSGHIVNVLSRAAESGWWRRAQAGYSASKAALWALTGVAAMELEEFGISVTGLVPGSVYSKLNPKGTVDPSDLYDDVRQLVQLEPGHGSGFAVFEGERRTLASRPLSE